ncbi:unnamed protein product [Owenia fusiformis]|uniref:Metalloendopeptidase n=1 Tax=Owenia fusiformis TaxID=6347 RepID=A0A8S4NZS0_OWEFU|nr:unnamed protein product [Owenia fusiformis]
MYLRALPLLFVMVEKASSLTLQIPFKDEQRNSKDVSEENEIDQEMNSAVEEPIEEFNKRTDLMEADIKTRVIEASAKGKFRNAFKFDRYTTIWPDGKVVYRFDTKFSPEGEEAILAAMKHITDSTRGCITFAERKTERDFLNFSNKLGGCWSYIGMQYDYGAADISLTEPGCTTKVGTIVHELVHALGFWHEHNRSDRDEYIKLHSENIKEGKEVNFQKEDSIDLVPFDYGSIMMYGRMFFSKNGKPTIEPLETGATIGQRDRLSETDVSEIRKLYNYLLEGDVKVQPKDKVKAKFKNAFKFEHWTRKWPGGKVAYTFHTTFSSSGKKAILDAMKHITSKTGGCIKFAERKSERDYLDFSNKLGGCWSYIGMQYDYGPADVSLSEPGCVYKFGTVVHELVHALGFWHEHTHKDRDKYIKINTQNIQPGKEEQFKKQESDTMGPFDYDSIMMYGPTFFSKNGKPTIEPLKKGVKIGQRDSLSKTDVAEIKKMYGCK